jgi:alkylation response protein AidB-like acyl-CoA dehydrogenase
MTWLTRILGPAPARTEPETAAGFARDHARATRDLAAPIERAIVGGLRADRVAYAFAAGYGEALAALLGGAPLDEPTALCVTERGGAQPRAIEARIEERGDGAVAVTGEKRWTTLAAGEGALLVAAREGVDADGRPRLRVVRVPAGAAGVTITRMPETPFVPEIPHVEVRLEGVVVPAAAVLPGDGYARYVKPFRTVEDVHVHGAVLGYVLGVARAAGWPASIGDRLVALLVALSALAGHDPLAPATHVALAGIVDLARRLLDEAAPLWALAGEPARARWERDRALLFVAEKARVKRLESARRALDGSSDPPR